MNTSLGAARMAASTCIRSTPLVRTFTFICNKPSSLRFSLSQSTSSTTTTTTSPFSFRCPRDSPSPPSLSFSLRLPRELTSLLPAHTAVASASLVSRLPHRPNTSAECRFANYVSPI